MTRDEVIEIWGNANGWSIKEFNITITELERFAQLIDEREREECAKVCEVHGSMAKHSVWMAEECAALIRARGNK